VRHVGLAAWGVLCGVLWTLANPPAIDAAESSSATVPCGEAAEARSTADHRTLDGIPPGSRPHAVGELRELLAEIDRQAAGVKDIVARFEERKFTGLLKEPLVSQGEVRILGERSRWDTFEPRRTVMVIEPSTLRIYYPSRSVVEEYPLDERLAWAVVSPLPRLAALEGRFRIERVPLGDLGEGLADDGHVRLRLTPTDSSLAEYVEHVDVVLAAHCVGADGLAEGFSPRGSAQAEACGSQPAVRAVKGPYVARAEIVDADQDRTVMLFQAVQINTGVKAEEVELVVPPGTSRSRPLGGSGRLPAEEAESRD